MFEFWLAASFEANCFSGQVGWVGEGGSRRGEGETYTHCEGEKDRKGWKEKEVRWGQ